MRAEKNETQNIGMTVAVGSEKGSKFSDKGYDEAVEGNSRTLHSVLCPGGLSVY
jgi:hypothetical protein